eukprot:5295068-Amphidinium_carterae.4
MHVREWDKFDRNRIELRWHEVVSQAIHDTRDLDTSANLILSCVDSTTIGIMQSHLNNTRD